MSSNKQHRQVKNVQKQQSASEATSFERLVNKTDRPKTQEAEGKDLAEKRERRAKLLKQAKKMAGAAASASIKGVDIASDAAYNTIKQLEATKNPVEQTSEADGAGSVSKAYIDVAHGSKKAFKNALEQTSKNKDAAKKASQNLEKVKTEQKKIEKIARQKRVTKKAARAQILESSYRTRLGTGNALGRLSSRIVGTLNHATAKPRAVIGATKKVTGGIKAVLAGGISAVLVGPACILLICALLTGVFGAASSASALGGVEAQVYLSLKELDFSDTAIAGILGNMMCESGADPALEGNLDGVGHYRYERNIGLFQYTHASNDAPPSSTCDCEYCSYKRWCNENNIDPYSASSQIRWTFSGEEGTSSYTSRWGHYDAYQSVDGYQARFSSDAYSASSYLDADDIELAIYSWMACYEKPIEDYRANLVGRLAAGTEYLNKIKTGAIIGSGQGLDGVTSRQLDVYSATQSTPSPGAGWCAAWVSQVMAKVGISISGNACCQYFDWCTSSNTSDLKVGMIVAMNQTVTSNGLKSCGHYGYGHVGIYIGDGQVISNRGKIVVESLEDFSKSAYPGVTVKWGWAGGVDLSK